VKTNVTTRCILGILLFLTMTSLALPAGAAEPQTVAIMPFTVHAEKDLTFLQEGIMSMLGSRLAWEDKVRILEKTTAKKAFADAGGQLDESTANSLGARLGVDYILFGSLTVFGQSVSMDGKMVDLSGSKPTLSFSNQSQGMDQVIPRVDLFAAEINEKVFGRKTAAAAVPSYSSAVPAGAPAAPAATPESRLHPEKLLSQGYGSGLSPFVMYGRMGGDAGFWKSKHFRVAIRSVAGGDVDGDGKIETVFASEGKLHIYRFLGERFVKIQEMSLGSGKIVGVDVADINKNGREEIFVTIVSQGSRNLSNRSTKYEDASLGHMRLGSRVLEWDGSTFRTLFENQNMYYRVLRDPMRGKVLLGQRRAYGEMFVQEINELRWEDGEYVPTGNRYVLPSGFEVFGFAVGDILNNGGTYTLAFSQRDKLVLFSPSGQREWTSEGYYGGSELSMEYPVHQMNVKDNEYLGDNMRIYHVPQRIFITDLNRDGKFEVVVVKNHATMGRTFKHLRTYNGAQVVSLSWNGLGLIKDWMTRRVSGYFADIDICDVDNDGEQEILVAVVSKKGDVVGTTGKSSLIIYEINSLERASDATPSDFEEANKEEE
jgi:TolB-like protein